MGVLWLLAGAAPLARGDIFIATNSFWHFFRGTNEASEPLGTEWRTNTFDDSAWELGQAPFQYGTNFSTAGGTVLSDMQSNYTCFFMRTTFVVSNAAQINGLTNRPLTDDGFIIWINGSEVRRFNVPGTAGSFVEYTNHAITANFTQVSFQDNTRTNLLRSGTNVLAIQVFNVAVDDADVFSNPQLALGVVDVTPPFVQSISPEPGTIASLNEITVTFSEPVTGVSTDDLRVNGQTALAVTGGGATYTFTFGPVSAGPVEVTWDANQVILDTANLRFNEVGAGWTYNLVDTLAPAVASLTPAMGAVVAGLSQAEVLFSEPVSGVDAGDLLINGQPSVSVFGSGAGPYIFQFPPPSTGTVQFAWAPGHDIRDNAATPNPFAGGAWMVTFNPALFEGDVIINEFLAANVLNNNPLDVDEDGELQDWIELYNRGSTTARLLGWSLTDDPQQPGQWTFPDISLAPGQYLLVYASGKDRKPVNGKLHTNFKLNPFGSYLGLFNAQSPRVAATEFAPEYPEQRNDYSYGLVSPGQWRYFSTPTPAAANGNSTIAQVAPKPHLSVKHGYFNQPFALIATCDLPGASLRYTTDGSEPTAATGVEYTGPLWVTNTLILRIAAFAPDTLPSKTTTQTYLFLNSVLHQDNNPGNGFPNTFGTEGAFVSPADYEMDPEIVTNAAYRDLLTNALLSLPVISIMIKPADMWDPATGIYTHAQSRGPSWERPCSMEFFTPDLSEQDFQVDAGLQMQGNASREPLKQPKHPMKVQFKGDYGPAKLKYKIFHDSPRNEFDSLNLRMDFNFSWLHWDGNQRSRGQRTRDAWMKDSLRAMGDLASHNRYVHLYINGLYWGICDPTERPDATFAAAYIGGDKEDYDVANEGAAVNGTLTEYNKMLALPTASTIQQYEQYKHYLDMTQFIDYMLLHFYVGHEDWGFNKNWYTMRHKDGRDGFRYVPWDGENILSTSLTQNRVSNTDVPSGLHTKLVANTQYKSDFADRVHKAFFNDGPLTPASNIARWMNRANQVDLAVICESARWGDYRRDVHVYQNPPYELYTRNNQWITEQNRLVGTYFPQRTATVLSQLKAVGLYPNVSAPVFSQYGGRIPPGFALTMTATNPIYFSTNGIDPRVYGTGTLSPLATLYDPANPLVIGDTMVVKARALFGTTWSALNETTFTVSNLTVPLRITEIMYNPIGGDPYEYIELQNIGSTPLDIGNDYFDGINFSFTFGTMLAAGQRIVLGNNANTNAFNARYPGVPVAGWFGGSLANGGEKLTVFDGLGRTIVSVTYDDGGGWPTEPDGGGYSLEIIDPNGDSNDPANWRASCMQNGSPGQANCVPPAPAVVLNEVMAENLTAVNHEGTHPDWIEIFNPSDGNVNLTGWSLTDNGNARQFVFPGGTTIAAGGYLVVWCDSRTNTTSGLHSDFALGRKGDSVFLYDANTNRVDAISFGLQVADYSIGRIGNAWTLTTPSLNAPNVAATVASGAGLSINEWLANAAPGADDWIELFNPSSAAPVALHDVFLGTSNALYQLRALSFVPPLGFVQLIADENPGPDHLDFKLPASSGAIVLYDALGSEVQRVNYGAQNQGVSEGRLPDGAGNIVPFPGSASPAAANYLLSYQGPVLNEVLARNSGVVGGPWGNGPDYVEIYNPSLSSVDLGGMGLSDDAGKVRFTFAPGTIVAPNGYLVVWCDGSRGAITTDQLNTGFSLSGVSGGVYLFNAVGQVVDSVEYGFQVWNLPIGLSGGAWRLLADVTPGTANAGPAALGSPAGLRLNEWMADPTSGDDWFELFNLDPQPVNLSGLFLSDDPSLAGVSNTPIAALSFIGGNNWVQWMADGHPSNGRNHVGFSLDKAGDTIRLYGADFSIIDSVAFGAQATGVSQGRLPDGGANMVSFPSTPTPGESNYLPLPDIVLNEVLTHTDPPLEDAIEIQNLGASPVGIGDWFISNAQTPLKKFRIASGTTLGPGAFAAFYEYQFNADSSGSGTNFTLNSAHGDAVYLSEADAAGNLTGYRAQIHFGAAENAVSFGRFVTSVSVDFVAMERRTFGADAPATINEFRTGAGLSNSYPKIGPLIINEIMYHPVSGGGSNTTESADEEFIELYNASNSAVPLFDPAFPADTWRLSGGVDFTFSSNTTVAANSYLLVVGFDPTTNLTALLNFQGKYGTDGTIVGPFKGRLENTGEAVELYRPDAPQQLPHPDAGFVPMILVDRVAYDDVAPWPTAAAGGGASLQRVASTLYGNEPLNWKGEPPTAGTTNIQGPLVAPTISVQPTNRSVTLSGSANFFVGADGSVPLSYQWQHATTNVPGANHPTLTLENAQISDAGLYRVIITNAAGSIMSQDATLTVLAPPVIESQPQPQDAIAGTAVAFAVIASGTAPLHYQWRFNGGDLADQTGLQLTLNNVQPSSEGNYAVVISNSVGVVTSAVAVLTVRVPPVITSQPSDATVNVGDPVTFTASATGTAPLVYQWHKDGMEIAGATGASYSILSAQASNEGAYWVVVSNSAGSSTSLPAFLRVNVAPALANPHQRGDGLFEFTLLGQTNRNYSVEFTSTFGGWTNLTNVTLSAPQATVVDAGSTNAAVRFYRARLP